MVTAALVKTLREKTGAGMLDCKKALEATEGNLDAAIDYLREKGIAKAAKKSDRIAAEGLCNIVVDGDRAYIYEVNSETDFVAKNDQFLTLIERVGKVISSAQASDTEAALAAQDGDQTLADIIVEATAKIGEKLSLRRVYSVQKESTQSFGAYLHMGGRIASLTVVEGSDETLAKDIAMHVAANQPQYLDSSQISQDFIAHEREVLRNEALNEGKPEAIVDKMVEGRLNKYLKEICLVNQPFVKNPDVTVEAHAKSSNSQVLHYIRLEVGEGIEKRQDDFAAEVQAQMKG